MSRKLPLRKKLNKALVSLFVILVFVIPPILTIRWLVILVTQHDNRSVTLKATARQKSDIGNAQY